MCIPYFAFISGFISAKRESRPFWKADDWKTNRRYFWLEACEWISFRQEIAIVLKRGEFNIVKSIRTDKYAYIPWLPECYMKQIELNYVIAIDNIFFYVRFQWIPLNRLNYLITST